MNSIITDHKLIMNFFLPTNEGDTILLPFEFLKLSYIVD